MLEPDLYVALARGIQVTLTVTAWAVLLGSVIGMAGGIASVSRWAWLRRLTLVYVEVFRGVSAIILLFWAAFALPMLFPFSIGPGTAAVLALGTNMGAYATELVKAAIRSVPRGQTEASISLSLTNGQALRHVVLPQAALVALPPYGNLCIEVLKASALVALIGLTDVVRVAQMLRNNRAYDGITAFGGVLVVYFILSACITLVVRAAERRAGRHISAQNRLEVTVK